MESSDTLNMPPEQEEPVGEPPARNVKKVTKKYAEEPPKKNKIAKASRATNRKHEQALKNRRKRKAGKNRKNP